MSFICEGKTKLQLQTFRCFHFLTSSLEIKSKSFISAASNSQLLEWCNMVENMEPRKYEATWAKAVAEHLIEQKDYIGAKKCALKANYLYPGLEGISDMLIVLEVYLRAEKMITGEPDWYRVLDVHPLAAEDTMKKQYKKLSLMLHPDKNRSIGAAGAFHLISHAYRLLKDRQLREEYDERCRFVAFPLRATIIYCTPSGSCLQNVLPYSDDQSVPGVPSEPEVPTAPQQRSDLPEHAGGSSAAPRPTFWTICSSCRIYFEYDRKYYRCNFRCQECNTPFRGIDVGLPKFSGSGPVPWKKRKRQSANSSVKSKRSNTKANGSGGSGTKKGGSKKGKQKV